jgi:hypothetical protein
MIGAFNTVYSALQGFLSRDFWATMFVPVALFAALHTLVAEQLGLIALTWNDVVSPDAGTFAKSLTLIMLGLVLVGYLLQPLLPLFRGLADGSLLPGPLQSWLLNSRRSTLTPEQDRLRVAQSQEAGLTRCFNDIGSDDGPVHHAYVHAGQLAPALARPALADEARAMIDALTRLLATGRPPAVAQMNQASDAVLRMLAANNPTLRPAAHAVPDADQSLSIRTDQIANDLLDLAQRAANEAKAARERIEARMRLSNAIEQPRPTALGDARFVAERYPQDVYAVRFDFLWPRLVLALRNDAKDDACLAAIDQGRARCDFAILSCVLSLSLPVVWLPYLLTRPGHGPLFLIIDGAAPLIAGFFYRLAVETQLGLADAVKATIDRHRIRVLKSFGQPPPASRGEEQLVWQRIAAAEDNSDLAFLAYAPEPKS